MKTITHYSILNTTSLGNLLLTADENHLTGIYFEDCDHVPASRSQWRINPEHEVLVQASTQLEEYFKGTRARFSIPLRSAGTDFQERIWQEIALIPFGQTITYSDLADWVRELRRLMRLKQAKPERRMRIGGKNFGIVVGLT